MGAPSPKKKTVKLDNYVSWFEIPVLDLDRAAEFFNNIYGFEMETHEMNGYAMAYFPVENGIGGALVCGQGYVPRETGALIYLNAGADLNTVLGKVNEAGGRVIMEKTIINELTGYFALFIDTEGNKLALHSKK